MADFTEFINKLAELTDLDQSVLKAWVNREKGVNNNVLGLTSGGSLRKFSSQTEAATATAKLINTSPLYAGIRNAANGTREQQALAIAQSPWRLGQTGLRKVGGTDPYYLAGFQQAGILGDYSKPSGGFDTPSAISPIPSGGVSTPIDATQTSGSLGAFTDIVSFPVGHRITKDDADLIMKKLYEAGYFGKIGDPLSNVANATAALNIRKIVDSWIGKEWNKSLQDTAQRQFQQSADEAKPGINFDIVGAVMFLGVILVGIAFIGVGGLIVLRKK